MKKTITALLLSVGLLLGCLCGAKASSLTKAERYEAYLTELHRYFDGDDAMTMEELVNQFNKLGNYKKSAAFTYYVSILRDTEVEDFGNIPLHTTLLRLDEDFAVLLEEAGFPSVDAVEAYALGRQAQAAGDWPDAIAHYEKSISVLDSMRRIAHLRMAGPTATPTPVPTPVPTPTPTPVPTPTPTPSPTLIPYRDETSVHIGDFWVNTHRDGTCEIAGYHGTAWELVIPQELNGYQVVTIKGRIFTNNDSLITVVIPDSVTSIEDYAFSSCDMLRNVTLPRNLKTIGAHAFSYCKKLTSVSIPHGTVSIGDYAFLHCDAMTSVTIPDSVTSIGIKAFRYCCSLTTVAIPGSVSAIGESAFEDCTSLESVFIANGVTSIGAHAFRNCQALADPLLPDSIAFIGDSAFSDCSSLTSISIPNGISTLGVWTFSHCTTLNSAYIPDSVVDIHIWAFAECPNLTLYVKRNSYAHKYARSHGIPYTFY